MDDCAQPTPGTVKLRECSLQAIVSRNVAVTDAGHAAENVPGDAAGQARGHALQEGVRLPRQVRLHPRHARAGPPHRVRGCHLRERRCVSKQNT